MSLTRIEWKEAEKICSELYTDNHFLSPYQEYGFLTQIMKSSNIRRRKEFKKFKIEIYKFEFRDEAQAVLPLCVNHNEKMVYLVGEFASVGHLDYIYGKEFSLEMFTKMLQELSELFKGYTFSINRISEFSKTNDFLMQTGYQYTSKEICVKIDVNDRDEWYKGLSKSCRQNIRTSHNRLDKENCVMSYCSNIDVEVSKKLWNDNLKLFSRRICEHCKLPVILAIPMYFLKKNESLTKALLNNKNNIVAGVYINGKAVATCNGLIANDSRAIITRLSIDLKWGKYSPGGLLIECMMDEISKKYPFITSIDLSRGDEPYKYTYGGKEHYNYNYKIVL